MVKEYKKETTQVQDKMDKFHENLEIRKSFLTMTWNPESIKVMLISLTI